MFVGLWKCQVGWEGHKLEAAVRFWFGENSFQVVSKSNRQVHHMLLHYTNVMQLLFHTHLHYIYSTSVSSVSSLHGENESISLIFDSNYDLFLQSHASNSA